MACGWGVNRRWTVSALVLSAVLMLSACTDGEQQTPRRVATPGVESQPVAATRKSWGGAEIYDEVCDKCHKMGVDGAPELGDVEAWQPRLEKGQEVLFDHVLEGFKKMPARGECEFCSDEQLRAAMEFMIARSRD